MGLNLYRLADDIIVCEALAMGAFPGTVNPFNTPYGLSNYGPWPPVFLNQTPPLTAAAANLGTLAIPAMNHLYVNVMSAGLSGSDSIIARFNADSGANYVTRFATIAAGGVIVADAAFASATSLRLSPAATTQGQSIWLSINNFLSVSKQIDVRAPLFTGAVATAATLVIGGAGEWVNTTAQITSVQILLAGANNFNAGSSVTIWGSN